MLTPEPFISHIISHILTAPILRTALAIFLSVAFRREIFFAYLAPLCILREQFRREIFVKRKHRAEKIVAVNMMLTDELHAHTVEQNTVSVHTVTALFSDELIDSACLMII